MAVEFSPLGPISWVRSALGVVGPVDSAISAVNRVFGRLGDR